MTKATLQGVRFEHLVGRRNIDDPKDPHRYLTKDDIGKKRVVKLVRNGKSNEKTGYERVFNEKMRELRGENMSGRGFSVVFKKRKRTNPEILAKYTPIRTGVMEVPL